MNKQSPFSPTVSAIVAFVVGILIGLFVFDQFIWTVILGVVLAVLAYVVLTRSSASS